MEINTKGNIRMAGLMEKGGTSGTKEDSTRENSCRGCVRGKANGWMKTIQAIKVNSFII